jgi:protein-L-isoaspartate(D-aspartate) O-methyltransferase
MKYWPIAMAAMISVIAPALPSGAQPFERMTERKKLAKIVMKTFTQAGMRKDPYVRPTVAAMIKVPRHLFVPQDMQDEAYLDKPLSIGYDQTISAPSMVAFMTSLAHVKSGDTVLEVGTGSGYQAAILSVLVKQVYTIEIVAPLAKEAETRFVNLGYPNVTVRSGDGYAGWPEQNPFDAIIVTAGATHVPPALLEQLKAGGRMVIPLGPNWAQEELTLIEKQPDGTISQKKYGRVFFVDFTGGMGRKKVR